MRLTPIPVLFAFILLAGCGSSDSDRPELVTSAPAQEPEVCKVFDVHNKCIETKPAPETRQVTQRRGHRTMYRPNYGFGPYGCPYGVPVSNWFAPGGFSCEPGYFGYGYSPFGYGGYGGAGIGIRGRLW